MYNGIGVVLQFAVPLAVPDAPFDVTHATDLTPALSVAIPLTTRVLADVA